MTPEELQASVDAFLRDGGTITKLNYAGVPVDDEYGRPIHVPARAEPPVETVKEWCERVAAPVVHAFEDRINTAILEAVTEPRCFYTELRTLRADARRVMADLERWAA